MTPLRSAFHSRAVAVRHGYLSSVRCVIIEGKLYQVQSSLEDREPIWSVSLSVRLSAPSVMGLPSKWPRWIVFADNCLGKAWRSESLMLLSSLTTPHGVSFQRHLCISMCTYVCLWVCVSLFSCVCPVWHMICGGLVLYDHVCAVHGYVSYLSVWMFPAFVTVCWLVCVHVWSVWARWAVKPPYFLNRSVCSVGCQLPDSWSDPQPEGGGGAGGCLCYQRYPSPLLHTHYFTSFSFSLEAPLGWIK